MLLPSATRQPFYPGTESKLAAPSCPLSCTYPAISCHVMLGRPPALRFFPPPSQLRNHIVLLPCLQLLFHKLCFLPWPYCHLPCGSTLTRPRDPHSFSALPPRLARPHMMVVSVPLHSQHDLSPHLHPCLRDTVTVSS